MTVYIVNFIINMALGLILFNKRTEHSSAAKYNINNRKKLYLWITALQFGLLCGFRSTEMAYDTDAYREIFDLCPGNWNHIFDKTSYVEVGFRVICSVIKIFGGDYQTMLIITSMFVMGSCCVFIYRHSKDVVLSVFIIICFPFYYSSFDIIRHFLATAFFLLGHKYIEERKFFKFLLFIVMGSLFQSAALLFLPFYFVKKIKWNFFTVFLSAVGTGVLYFFIEPIAVWLSDILGKSSGVESGWIDSFGGGIRTAIMYGVILFICIMQYTQLKNKTEEDSTAISYIILTFLFSVVFTNARMMTRMIMTMAALLAIAVPQLFDKPRADSSRDYSLQKICFIAIGIFYHAFMLLSNWQNVVPYIPFWR